jgi:hypothetical protein
LIKKLTLGEHNISAIILGVDQEPDSYMPKSLNDFREGIFTSNGILMGSFSSENKLLFGV